MSSTHRSNIWYTVPLKALRTLTKEALLFLPFSTETETNNDEAEGLAYNK